MKPAHALLVVLYTGACSIGAHHPSAALTIASAPDEQRTAVQLQADEADAALAIVRLRAAGATPGASDWMQLVNTQGYRALKEREASMHRPFTDSSFAAFLTSDTLVARFADLAGALAPLERIDVTRAAARARAYLPGGATLRARLYLEIKPFTNSFVFTGRDSMPAILLYVDPKESAAQLENTMSHELHHIGLNGVCPDIAYDRLAPAQAMLLRFLGGFGEGQAMLAAAGGPEIHPHAADADSIKRRWDADVARAPADVRAQSMFFTAVLDGRIASADSVRNIAVTYYGVQGPWYTVGWLMAATIERQFGRTALVATLCAPTQFMSRYNEAARHANAAGAALPVWDNALVTRLEALRRAAGP